MRQKTSSILFLLFLSLASVAQLPEGVPKKGLKGFWSFSGNANDESGNQHHGKVNGARTVSDRFENKNSAYFFNGVSDFISTDYEGVLGSHARAVSFWLRTDVYKRPMPIVAWGSNSMHPEKGTRFDCGMNYKTKGASIDVSDAAMTYEPHRLMHDGQWHHYVYQFTIPILEEVEIYQDGVKLTHEETTFYPIAKLDTKYSYPVQFGRIVFPLPHPYFFEGQLDDIAIYDRALSQEEILALYNTPDPTPDYSKLIAKWAIIIVILLVLVVLIRLYVKQRIQRALKKEKEQNHLRNNKFEQQNKVLKAQMDPHFIFNSLNTIQQFIITNENDKAQNYLYKFSRLIRLMIESNVKESISLEDEIDLIEKYLEIESLRFENVFNYNITVPKEIDPAEIFIPHFLLQPFIENAIWHALLPKPGDKHLEISFEIISEKILRCTIADNGVGRKNILEKTDGLKKKSLAINFIKKRLELMTKIYDEKYNLTIIDKVDEAGDSAGTTVIIALPILKK